MESNVRLQKSKFAYNRQKTKEEKLKEIEGLPKYIGPYEIIEKIKDGGYSKIYKAKSYYTGDFVAIKAIDKSCFQETVEDVLLMIRQTEVLKILKHRNLISLYEIFETTKYFYLIMDYLPNGDLIEKIIKQKRFKEEEALNIFSQLVDALYYMHQNEICHRDIRTEKIVFDANNKPKLVGFSYSTFYDKGKKIKDNYGSLCYACPEIIQNEYYNPELADVWSLGVVLYVMICGYLPFSEEDDEVNKELIINGEVEYPPEVSNKAKDLLKHMLDVNPNKRYNFQRIIKHPWFKPYNESTLTGGINTYKMIYPIDERILKIIIIYGFKKNEVDMNLKQNKFNEGTALYKQLVDKFIGMGFTSYSDLCSDQFMEFRKDKENTITDGDKKYKKYINRILEKIKKVERYVNDYKKKEDNIVKELDTIYSNVEAEEMKKEMELQNNIKKNNINKATNEKNNGFPRMTHRRTISTVKEQKELKQFLASRIGYLSKEDKNRLNNNNKKAIKEVDEDFDFLKDFQKKQSKVHDASSFMYLDDDDEKKMRKAPSSKKFREKEFVQNLLDKADKNDNDEYSLLSSRVDISNLEENNIPKRKRQLSVMIKRKKKKNYLNTSTINDSYLRKPKDESQRKKIIKDNLINTVQQVIVEEENLNEDNEGKNDDIKKNLFGETNKPSEPKKNQKNIKYSLSFGEDDYDEDESGFISKIDSKQVSMCLDIDEELKELKEIRNTLKSPAPCRIPYMKKNTKDNKYYNFNIDNNNTIFGENLDENNTTNNTNATALADVNERYDILTQLKKLSEGKTPTLSESRLEEENKNIGKNQFNNDSFGDNKNNKGEFNSIRFENETEISFHEDNKISNKKSNHSDNNYNNSSSLFNPNRNDLIYYFNDKITIKKMNDFNKNEEFKLSVSYIHSKREKNYGFTYEIDSYPIKKLKIKNLMKNLDINAIELKRLKGKNKASKNNKEKTNKKINIKKESPNKKTKEKAIVKSSKKKDKETSNKNNDKVKLKSKDKKDELKQKESSESIDSLMRGNSNIINFFNNDDNLDDTVHIIEDIDDIGGDHDNDFNNNNNNNNNINNNITINSNNNIINNISINNNNNPNNNDKIKKNKSKNKKDIITMNTPNTLDWSKLTNKFKKENKTSLDVLSSFCEPEKPSILSRNQNKKNIYSLKSHKKTVKFNSTIYNQDNDNDNDNPLTKSSLFTKNNKNNSLHRTAKSNIDEYISTQVNEERTPISLRKKGNKSSSVKMPSTHKRVNSRISVEKTLHSNLMSNDFENPNDTNKLIAKVKKGQKIYQSVINDKPSNERNNLSKTINYSKNTNLAQNKQIKKSNIIAEKKPKTNYVQQYHKRINSNINNNYCTNRRETELNQKKYKHNKNKSDMINYDYVFSVYNDSNKNNSISKKVKPSHSKNQSTGGNYYQTYRENDEDDENDNNLNNQKISKFKI